MADTWTADLWVDPSCPYSRLTARWLMEAVQVRPISLRWHVMSLAVLNEGRDDDPEGDPEGYLWIPARICAAVQTEHGHDALGRFYDALWESRERGGEDWVAGFEEVLAGAGLPADLARAGFSEAYDAALRASHDEGFGLVGGDVGTPVLAATAPDGTRAAVFGPVVSEVPRGESAGRLWDGTVLVAATPGFHTLQGPPQAQIAG
ncbi:disulfide bond formation protein DsbA [Streptomonospora sp. PA3]|uniref:mycothiol-dependent nitroreductase Rv2466c family protein n=1 Tax=Streptomonospora sp. PA3 TaxID=2607326 RepID=UPI0012DCBE13|nr:disulfide bond formation protein DsbA [Streptomonospora sp. PA3]MUL42287.1 disulfide bond formation protein DsbA [Streptomonospora sp. PA3]